MPQTDEQIQMQVKKMQAEIRSNREQTAARGIILAPDDMKPLGSFADDAAASHDANRNPEPDAKEK